MGAGQGGGCAVFAALWHAWAANSVEDWRGPPAMNDAVRTPTHPAHKHPTCSAKACVIHNLQSLKLMNSSTAVAADRERLVLDVLTAWLIACALQEAAFLRPTQTTSKPAAKGKGGGAGGGLPLYLFKSPAALM